MSDERFTREERIHAPAARHARSACSSKVSK